jgi:hypothetical protein
MVSAETHGQALERMCPNGASIKDFERRIHEADAMQDSIRYQLRYDEAREFFRCSKTVTNPYIVDSATFLYAIDLAQSARTNVEADERGHTAASAFNELAASTRFDDLRKLAIDLRDSTRKYADEAHNAIYGSSDPSSSPATEVPTDTPTP